MATQTLGSPTGINGVDVQMLQAAIDAVSNDPEAGMTNWSVTTRWAGGTISKSRIDGFGIGGQYVPRSFELTIDEPHELCGTNTFPNPQEYLLSALNACMTVGYVACASLLGVKLESLEIETRGDIDLRGFFGLNPNVKPGYDQLHYTVRIKGDGTEAQFRQIHEMVAATSPNRFNLASPIQVTSELVVQ